MKQSVVSTNAHTTNLGAAAKARLQKRGVTLVDFAKKNGLKFRTVSEVVRGVNKGARGEGHRAAVALGMK
jgi:gp16 family phage-associated protein